MAPSIIVMGVAGCGKSTIGRLLAERRGWRFVDGDDLHPPANVAKMAGGEALTDDDRAPWLDAVGRTFAETGGGCVIACSALKRIYRERITAAAGAPVTFVHLSGSRALIGERMAAREDHFMPTALLDSQFATLEPPTAEERALTIGIEPDAATIVEEIVRRIDDAG